MPQLLPLADPTNPLVWLRADRGCVGIGELTRFTFRGADRLADAAKLWAQVVAMADIDDTVNLPTSGLMAFGTFAFDNESAAESVLIVPRLIVARNGNEAWVTQVSFEPIVELQSVPPARARTSWSGVTLDPSREDEAYLESVTQATRRLEEGELQKVVLSRQLHATLSADDDVRVALTRLAYAYQDCWTYAIDGMIGASPETLVRHVYGRISARVLAGTRSRQVDEAADLSARDELFASDKELSEHTFAINSVTQALSPLVEELTVSEEPFALQLPNVWHLASDLSARPHEGVSTLDIVDALHPTAAVAGTPTAEAVSTIRELEQFDRGRYAGAVGWIGSHNDGDWVIALRCAQLGPVDGSSRSLTAYAGGGIVQGSVAKHEMRETVAKFQPIVHAFAPAAGSDA